MNIKKQKNNIYLYAFAANLRITDAVWVVLLAARGFALWQIGLAEGIFHIVSLLAEIPSGMAADLLGRRRTLALSGVAAAFSGLVMAFSNSFALVCAAMALSALSVNLISGTQEALTYDSLVEVGQSGTYLQVEANVCQVQAFASMLGKCASVLSGILSFVGYYLLSALLGLARTVAALRMVEPVVTQKQAARRNAKLSDLPARLREHVTLCVQFLRGNPRVGCYIAANAAIALPCYLIMMFLQQRMATMGFPTALLGLLLLVSDAALLLGTAIGRRLRVRSLLWLYGGCMVLCGVGAVLAGGGTLPAALAGAMCFSVGLNIWDLHAQRRLNDAYPSDQRATLVSVDSMAYSVLMIAASPLTGLLGDVSGNAGAGLCVLGLLQLLGAVLAFAAARRRKAA